MTAASNSEARKRLIEAQGRAESPASQPIPAPVDSGAIGRLTEAEREAIVSAEIACNGYYPDDLFNVVERIVREHTDRALAEVEQRIEEELICCDIYERLREKPVLHRTEREKSEYRSHAICYWGSAAQAIVRAARQEAPEHVTPACICPTDDYCPRCHPRWHANWSAARQERGR